MGDLMVAALRRHADRTVLSLGETEMTGGEMAAAISRYIQAFEGGLGAGTGTAVGLLALNRPEVLFVIGAGQTQGWRRTALHPLGSLDDHAYVLADAGVSTLIIDGADVRRTCRGAPGTSPPRPQAGAHPRAGARAAVGAGSRRHRRSRHFRAETPCVGSSVT